MKINRSLVPVFSIGVLFSTSAVSAAPWEFEASADLSVIHTDNLRLAADGQEESEIVYLVSPVFSLTTDGDRTDAIIRYRPEAYFYDDAPESDELFHVVDATLTTALVKDALFLYLSGTNFQTAISAEDSFPTSNLPLTGNRVDSTVYEVRPYWEQSLGFANIYWDVSLLESSFDFDESSPVSFQRDNSQRRTSFRLNNHEQQAGIAWGLDYRYQRIEYESAIPWDYQQVSANVGYWVNGTARIFYSGGRESSFTNFLSPALDDNFWEAGFQLRPNQRVNLEVAAGDRTFGNSVRGNLSYTLRRGQISLNYSEQPSTRAAIGIDRRPILESDNLNTIFDRPGETDRFVRKVGDLQATYQLSKSDFTFHLFSEMRDQRTSELGTALSDEELSGIAIRWNWRPGVKSTISAFGEVAERDGTDFRSDLNRFGFDYSYSFGNRLSMIFSATHSDEDGSGQSTRDYTENQIRLTLRATL